MPHTHMPPFHVDGALWKQLSGLEETGSSRQGEFLFHQGDTPQGAFLLLRGRVALSTGDARLSRNCLPGCLLGLPATLRNKPYSLTAECLSDCQYVRITHERLLSVLGSNREFCMRVVQVLAEEVGELRSRMPEEISRFERMNKYLTEVGWGRA